MKGTDYITIDDWNALGDEKQLALKSSLRFMGYRAACCCWPEPTITDTLYDWHGIGLDDDGDLVLLLITPDCTCISLEEVLSFIELTSFEVKK